MHAVMPLWYVTYRDTMTGEELTYNNEPEAGEDRRLAWPERALVNRFAFPSACTAAGSFPVKAGPSLNDVSQALVTEEARADGGCGSDRVVCLHNGRFKVLVDWKTWEGPDRRPARSVESSTESSAAFYFHTEESVDVLVKVTDQCSITGPETERFYTVQIAAATLDGFQVRVEDNLEPSDVRFYRWWEDEGMGTPPKREIPVTPLSINNARKRGLHGLDGPYRFPCQ